MSILPALCMHTKSVAGARGGQERMWSLESWELELRLGVSCPVDAGNLTGPLQRKHVFITTSPSLQAHSPKLASGHGVFHSNRKQTRTEIVFIYPLSLWDLAQFEQIDGTH